MINSKEEIEQYQEEMMALMDIDIFDPRFDSKRLLFLAHALVEYEVRQAKLIAITDIENHIQ